jgi:hypothetical protein
LEVYGVDLAAWWAGKRWVGLLDLIDMLPAACRLNEAVANDPETAAFLAELRLSGGKSDGDEWSPRVSEYDLHAMLLREMIQRLDGIYQASVANTGNKPPTIPPFPAPKTAIDKAVAVAEREWTESFVQQFGFAPDDI